MFAYGETRLAQGDTLAAALAFQTILTQPQAADPFSDRARQRLESIGLTPASGPPSGAGNP